MATLKTRRQANMTVKSAKNPTAEHGAGGYRVGSVSKQSGRILWAYDELLTLDEAETISTSSRLSILGRGTKAPRLIPLSPRAADRLAKLRSNLAAEPISCEVYAVVTDYGKVIKVTESKSEAEIYCNTYNSYHLSKHTATIRNALAELQGCHHSGDTEQSAMSIEVYVVTCGDKAVLATTKKDEVDAYTEPFNKYRDPSTAAATVTKYSLPIAIEQSKTPRQS